MRLPFPLLLVVIACGAAPQEPVDAGSPPVDAGSQPVDAGTQPVDAGSQPVDAGTQPVDAGQLDDSAAGLTAFVKSGAYKGWKAETAVHGSTGPHGGNVRTYVNDAMHGSLKAGNATHPPGSIAVKELYGSGTATVTGHAVDAKNAAGTWIFYEGFGPTYANPYYYQGTTNFCASCHASGPDYYRGLLSNLP